MSALAAQQRQLKQAIVRGDDAPGAAVSGRLHIYRQAYAARLVAALRDNFGALPQVLGDDAFDALARAYIEAYPSRKPSIRWFGDQLTAFMASRDDLVPHAAITDLARMEWALRAAFDAADANPIDVAALVAVAADAWPALVLVPLPSVQLLDMGWCVEPIWRALQGVAVGDELPELPEPEAFEHGLVVWRSGLATRWRSLAPPTSAWLRAAIDGAPFAALCTLAAEQVGASQAAPQVAAALRGWVDDGLFSAWRSATTGPA